MASLKFCILYSYSFSVHHEKNLTLTCGSYLDSTTSHGTSTNTRVTPPSTISETIPISIKPVVGALSKSMSFHITYDYLYSSLFICNISNL